MSRGTTGCRPLLLPSISFGSSWTVKEWPALCVHTSAPPQAWRCRARLSPTQAPGADTPRVCLWRFCCCLFVSGRPCRTKSQVESQAECSFSWPTRPWVPAGVCASVRFSAGLDIRPNLTLGPSLSAWTRCPVPWGLIGFHPLGETPCSSQPSCLAQGRSPRRLEIWPFGCPVRLAGPAHVLAGLRSRGQCAPGVWGSEVACEALAKTPVFFVLPGPCLTTLPRSSFYASKSTHSHFVMKLSEPCSMKAVSYLCFRIILQVLSEHFLFEMSVTLLL